MCQRLFYEDYEDYDDVLIKGWLIDLVLVSLDVYLFPNLCNWWLCGGGALTGNDQKCLVTRCG